MSEDAPDSAARPSAASRSPGEVFVSYASQDKAIADAVCAALEGAGSRCWIAPRDVSPGEFYADAIVRALNECPVLVLILTDDAVASPHVLREIERASSKRHQIVTLRLEVQTLPPALEYFLSASHWLEASKPDFAGAMPTLIEAVQRLLAGAAGGEASRASGKSVVELFPHAAARQSSRRWRRAALGIGAVIAMALVYLATGRRQVELPGAIDRPAAAVAPAPAPPAPAIPEKSVAVLPFVDMSANKDQEYFSDGLAEELIDMLTQVADLRVPARTSSFYFKGKADDVPAIAKRLLVAHVLEGSVRTAGRRVRVTAQLIRADNGYHVWSQTYDRELNDIFKVQDDIAAAVVKALKASLLDGRAQRPAPTTSSESHTLYLQARSLWDRGTPAENQRAIAYAKRALKLDPGFAAAWALLAEAESVAFSLYGTATYGEIRVEAHQAAERALEIDPQLAAAHVAMARIRNELDWDQEGADAEIRTAISSDPGGAYALRVGSGIARDRGRLAEAVARARSAVSFDPLNEWNYLNLGVSLAYADQPAEAEQALRTAVELNPTAGYIHGQLGALLIARGNPTAGTAELERETMPSIRHVRLASAFDRLGRKREADVEISAAEQDPGAQLAAGLIAYFYIRRDDRDRAVTWLERAYDHHESWLATLEQDKDLVPYKTDPRFRALLSRIKSRN